MKTARTITAICMPGAYDYTKSYEICKTRRHYYLEEAGFAWRGNEGGYEVHAKRISRAASMILRRIIRRHRAHDLSDIHDEIARVLYTTGV